MTAAPGQALPRDAYWTEDTTVRFVLPGSNRLDVDLAAVLDGPPVTEAEAQAASWDPSGVLVVPGRDSVAWEDLRAAGPPERRPRFSVDTHVFRELGELLVGRDSTAIVELIKNAYDADARTVRVEATGLASGESTVIRISDDGTGMTPEQFERGFLRIASRGKETGSRYSRRYGRRFTGAKGVGRLAVHKLAQRLTVDSSPDLECLPPQYAGGEQRGVHAELDWKLIEAQELVAEVKDGLEVRPVPPAKRPGTTLVLASPRARWNDKSVERFVEELRAARPSPFMHQPLEPGLLARPLLVPTHDVREARPDESSFPKGPRRADPGFSIDYGGELAMGDELWPYLVERTDWIVEIDARGPEVRYRVDPTAAHTRQHPLARPRDFAMPHPSPDDGPRFTVRILVREGAPTGPLRTTGLVEELSGIRVFLEGFRVLPYGGPGDDWLSINRDYTRKPRLLDVDDELGSELAATGKEGFYAIGTTQYTGAVFLLESRSPTLRALVNREGFVVDDAFEAMQRLVTNGVRLSVRARRALGQAEKDDALARARAAGAAAADKALLAAQAAADRAPGLPDPPAARGQEEAPAPDGHDDDPPGENIPDDDDGPDDDGPGPAPPGDRLAQDLGRAREALLSLAAAGGADGSDALLAGAQLIEAAQARLAPDDEDVAIRLLAGVGLQMSAFVHEINGLLGQAQTLRRLLALLPTKGMTGQQRGIVRSIDSAALNLVEALQRQSSYLTDIVGPRARARRSRTRLADRLDKVVALLGPSAQARSTALDTDIGPDLKTPPMFPSEVTILLTNLLTNAVKNARTAEQAKAGEHGLVRVRAGHDQDAFWLRVDNTGVAVDRAEADRWWRPFETTSVEIDEALGQGLGLGLPIVRRLVDEYGGTARFADPAPGFATAVLVEMPLRPRRRG